MAMTDNQCCLVRAVAENRHEDARKYAIACIAEDQSKKNAAFCRKYHNILNGSGPKVIKLPQNVEGLLTMEDVSDFDMGKYYLRKDEEELATKILHGQQAAIRLAEMNIPYVNATLLYGAPGTGKTLFGKYMAYRFGLPYVYVNFSYLIGQYMGATSRNLATVFRYIRDEKCVLMLDEIDCIGLRRGPERDTGADGELARTTITLMQELDKLTCKHIVLAATNRADRLDEALLRRFTNRHAFQIPSKDECIAMAEQFLRATGITYDKGKIVAYANAKERTQADMIRFATELVIKSVLEEAASAAP